MSKHKKAKKPRPVHKLETEPKKIAPKPVEPVYGDEVEDLDEEAAERELAWQHELFVALSIPPD